MGRYAQIPSLTRADRIELERIFVSASLPADHPHSIRLPSRKTSLFDAIAKSPSLGRKIKRRLSRSSLVSAKGLPSLSRYARNLLHLKAGARGRRLSIDDIAEDHPASTAAYDEDAHPVPLPELPHFNNDSHPVKRQKIPEFHSPTPCILR